MKLKLETRLKSQASDWLKWRHGLVSNLNFMILGPDLKSSCLPYRLWSLAVALSTAKNAPKHAAKYVKFPIPSVCLKSWSRSECSTFLFNATCVPVNVRM
jgi:hypothetical protein